MRVARGRELVGRRRLSMFRFGGHTPDGPTAFDPRLLITASNHAFLTLQYLLAISDTPSRIGLFRPNLAFPSPPPAPREQTQC